MDYSILIPFVVILLCGIASARLGEAKGWPYTQSFLMGFLLGPIGLLIAIFMKPKPKDLSE